MKATHGMFLPPMRNLTIPYTTSEVATSCAVPLYSFMTLTRKNIDKLIFIR